MDLTPTFVITPKAEVGYTPNELAASNIVIWKQWQDCFGVHTDFDRAPMIIFDTVPRHNVRTNVTVHFASHYERELDLNLDYDLFFFVP